MFPIGLDFQYLLSLGVYSLKDLGSLFQFELSVPSIHAVALLVQTFGGQVGEHSEIQDFLKELISFLPVETLERMGDRSGGVSAV